MPNEVTKQALEDGGFYVGPRDPKRNQKYEGAFMVCQDVNEGPSLDASGGEYCIVGDDLNALIVEAYEHNYREDEVREATITLKNVDWKLLRVQKETLVALVMHKGRKPITPPERDRLDGIVYLLDAIQDQMVTSGQADSMEIFGTAL